MAKISTKEKSRIFVLGEIEEENINDFIFFIHDLEEIGNIDKPVKLIN